MNALANAIRAGRSWGSTTRFILGDTMNEGGRALTSVAALWPNLEKAAGLHLWARRYPGPTPVIFFFSPKNQPGGYSRNAARQ